MPHSKPFIPLKHDCYYGNCSNKNKYILVKFTNLWIKIQKGVSKSCLSVQHQLICNYTDKKKTKVDLEEKLISHYNSSALRKIHDKFIVWKYPLGLFWCPQPQTTCSSPLTGFVARSSFAEHNANQNPSVWSGPPSCQLCFRFLGDVFFFFFFHNVLIFEPLALSAAGWPESTIASVSQWD